MPESDTIEEQQPNTDAAEAAAEETSPDTEEPHEINGQSFTLIGTTTKKGPKKGQPLCILKVEPNNEVFINKVRTAVGAENFDKCIITMVRTACKDATLQAISQAEDGVPTDEGFNKGFIEWFTDETRRSGPHVKDIKEKLQSLFAEVSPLMNRAFDQKAEPLTEAEHNKMVQLSVEFSDLQAKLEKIQGARKGKKAAKK